jgi:hypothetical protein
MSVCVNAWFTNMCARVCACVCLRACVLRMCVCIACACTCVPRVNVGLRYMVCRADRESARIARRNGRADAGKPGGLLGVLQGVCRGILRCACERVSLRAPHYSVSSRTGSCTRTYSPRLPRCQTCACSCARRCVHPPWPLRVGARICFTTERGAADYWRRGVCRRGQDHIAHGGAAHVAGPRRRMRILGLHSMRVVAVSAVFVYKRAARRRDRQAKSSRRR